MDDFHLGYFTPKKNKNKIKLHGTLECPKLPQKETM
jgi:hypothetical protein